MSKAKSRAASRLGTGADVYLYSLSRTAEVFATVGSDDCLRLFNPTLELTGKVHSAHSGITCLTAYDQGFLTGGRDGRARFWDARAKRAAAEISEPKGNGVASVACRENLVAVGTESIKEGLGDVSVLVFDIRNPSSPVRNFAESHTDTITQLCFNPELPSLLLSGSTDGLVSIFDIQQSDEDDALMQVFNPRGAIHCSGFLRRDEAYALTTDEHFSTYKVGDATYEGGQSEIIVGDTREKVDCTYVVGLAGSEQRPIMAVGDNVKETLSLLPLDPSNPCRLGKAVELPGAHGEEVVRDLVVLEDKHQAISCGEDGHVRLWDLPSTLAYSSDAMEVD